MEFTWKIWNIFTASITTLIVLCCRRIFRAMKEKFTTDELHDRDEDNYYIPDDRGIPVEESRDTTDLVTFPRGSYGARRVVLLGEDRNGVGSHGNRSRETTSSLIRLLIGPRYS